MNIRLFVVLDRRIDRCNNKIERKEDSYGCKFYFDKERASSCSAF
jgi:hypothetical protein